MSLTRSFFKADYQDKLKKEGKKIKAEELSKRRRRHNMYAGAAGGGKRS